MRISKTQKILNLMEALFDDCNPFLSYPELRKRLHGRWDGKLGEAIHNLKKGGYLEMVEKDNIKFLRLTGRGKLKAILPHTESSEEWDGQWRLVAFDIEEERRKTRDRFRELLWILGFKPLQKSVWIAPHDASEEIEKAIDLLKIDSNVDYFIAHAITDEEGLRRRFGLD